MYDSQAFYMNSHHIKANKQIKSLSEKIKQRKKHINPLMEIKVKYHLWLEDLTIDVQF